jgi:hypothetical protein
VQLEIGWLIQEPIQFATVFHEVDRSVIKLKLSADLLAHEKGIPFLKVNHDLLLGNFSELKRLFILC